MPNKQYHDTTASFKKNPFLNLIQKLLEFQGIIKGPGLKRTTMLIPFQPPTICRGTNQQPRLPRATSSLALNACRDGASTPPWATCSVRHHPLGEKLPPHIQPKPPLSHLKPFPLVLSLSTLVNSHSSRPTELRVCWRHRGSGTRRCADLRCWGLCGVCNLPNGSRKWENCFV